MVLVDTSVWIDHLQRRNAQLEALLDEGSVHSHPFVIGELACGNLKNRREILSLLQALPAAVEASHEEVILFVEKHRMMGMGMGFIDVHLLASARLTGVPLWTLDRKLDEAAVKIGLGMP